MSELPFDAPLPRSTFDYRGIAGAHVEAPRRLTRLSIRSTTVVWAIDDFAIAPVTTAERNDLLELLDVRMGTCATIVTSQFPVAPCHERLNDPTPPDAILDRNMHSPAQDRPEGRTVEETAGQLMSIVITSASLAERRALGVSAPSWTIELR